MLFITNLKQIYIVNPLIAVSFFTLVLLPYFTTKGLLYTARNWVSKGVFISINFPETPWKFESLVLQNRINTLRKLQIPNLNQFLEKDELFETPDRKETGAPLVVTHQPRFSNLSALVRKYIIFLCAKEKFKRVFTPAPFVTANT